MRIKVIDRDWKKWVTNPDCKGNMTRREAIKRGLVTAQASFLLPSFLGSITEREAMADTSCVATAGTGPGVTSIYGSGSGFNGDSIWHPVDQNGIPYTGTDLQNFGVKWGIDPVAGATPYMLGGTLPMNSADLFTSNLRLAPAGVTQATWDNILATCTVGYRAASVSGDDGGADGTDQRDFRGLIQYARAATMKEDLNRGGTQGATSSLGPQIASAKIGTTISSLNTVVQFPAPTLTNQTLMGITSNYVSKLANIYYGSMLQGGRLADNIMSTFGCGISSAVPMANPNYGATLFDLTKQTFPAAQAAAFTAATFASTAPTNLQVVAAGAYQSSLGLVLSQSYTIGGCDYHQTGSANISSIHTTLSDHLKYAILGHWLSGKMGFIRLYTGGNAIAADAGNGTGVLAATNPVGPVTNPTVPNAANDAGSFSTVEVGIIVSGNTTTYALPKVKHLGYSLNTSGASAPGTPSANFVNIIFSHLMTISQLMGGDPSTVISKVGSQLNFTSSSTIATVNPIIG